MTIEEIKTTLRSHTSWVNGRDGGVYANLTGANLTGANLTGANLTSANLTSAHLRGADLTSSNLTGANLTGANLTSANLTGANLTSANLPVLMSIRRIEKFRETVSSASKAEGCQILMKKWHYCETVHCLAGWVVTVHPEGKLLESVFSTPTAAALILIANGEQIPNFFDVEVGCVERAKNWLATGSVCDPQN